MSTSALGTAHGDIQVLDRTLLRGVSWTAAIKGATQLLSWGSIVVVAHLLRPADFGLVAMATLYIGLTALVTEFGLGTTIIAMRELSEEQLSQLHSVALLVGFGAFVVSCLVAYPLSRFFGAPELALVVVVLSSSLMLDSLRAVPTALLVKHLRFKYLASIEAVKAVVAITLTVGFALFGAKHWALVLGNVVGALAATLLLVVLRPQRFARPRFRSLKPILTFSSQLLLAQVAWYGYSNADFLVAGRVLGKVALGQYTLAWTMTSTPGDKIMAVFARVIPTMFAAVKSDAEAMRRYFLLFTEGLSILIIPASVGLALVAPDFVPLAFGAQWLPAVVPLQLLCGFTPIQMLGALLAPALQVKGDAMYPMRWALWAIIVLPVAFYFSGTRWGTTGIAAVWLTVYPLVLVPSFVRVFRLLGISLRAYLNCLRPTLVSTAVMTVVVLTVRTFIATDLPLAVRFGMQVATGAAAYVAAGLFFHRLGVLADFLRSIRAGRNAVAAEQAVQASS